ncbi:MAG: hypothetical protein WC742_00850 [Gallionellaceae bacterium]|jgi:hypothetical protein
MQVEAIYDHGRLEFIRPIQFKHERLNIIVEVPDEEILNTSKRYNLPQEIFDLAAKMTEQMDNVRNAPLPPDDQLPPVTAKTLERIEAFSLRADR